MTTFIHRWGAKAFMVGCLSAMATGAQALPTTELALGLDGSSSISSSDFNLQLNAYQNVLSDSSVLPQDGSVAIGVWSFGTSVNEVFSLTPIDSSNVGNLTTAIGNISGGRATTALGPAIEAAASALTSSGNASATKLIDISTDGAGNTGVDEDTAADDAVTAGVDQVNCLGVGAFADCGFTAGLDSFSVSADNFDDFEQSLRDKIEEETSTAVPTPTTVTLFVAGLIGLAAQRRWRSA